MKARDNIERPGSHTAMNGTQTGLLAGLLLGLATAAEGFSGFCIALVVGLAGLQAGLGTVHGGVAPWSLDVVAGLHSTLRRGCPLRILSILRQPAERGSLQIATAVIRKIAEYAADQNEDTARVPRRIAGIGAGSSGAGARVFRDDNDVDIVLDVGLRYPGSVRRTAERIREDVRTEVGHMTGCTVRTVRVTVSALLPDDSPRVR